MDMLIVIIVEMVVAIIVGVLFSFTLLRAQCMENKKEALVASIIISIVLTGVSVIATALFIVLAISMIICSLAIIITGNKEEGAGGLSAVVFLLSCSMLIIILAAVFFSYSPESSTEKVMTGKLNLFSVEYTKKLSESCSLFSCGTESERVYEIYYIGSSGGKTYSSINAKSISIFEEEEPYAFIGTYKIQTIKKWPELYQIIYGKTAEEYSYGNPFKEMHLPTGTAEKLQNNLSVIFPIPT